MLVLPIVTYWDGTPCANTRLHGVVTLGAEDEGLCLTASLPHQECPCVPATPPRTRVANLWEYDVVECFVVGAEGYLEVELGAGGHFLVLDFAAPRVRRKAYEAFVPRMIFEPCLEGKPAWRSSILIPWSMVPVHVQGVNAYVISRNTTCAIIPSLVPSRISTSRSVFPLCVLRAEPELCSQRSWYSIFPCQPYAP